MDPTLADLISLTGKRAMVTGAGSGIGRAIAARLAEAGAEPILVDKDQAGLEATRELVARHGRAVELEGVDLGDRSAIDALWERLADGPPDVLVNNAGIYPMEKFTSLPDESYRRLMAINLDAVVWMCQHMIRGRGRRGGVIVNIGSIEAVLPFKAELAHYSASKAGVLALTRALAKEYARDGFRINAVLPGGIVTPGTRQVARQVLQFKLDLVTAGIDFGRRLPAGRMGSPDEVARVVLFLASDLASYMHGAVVAVDGGFLSS